jgi:hypothetical protein
LKRNDGAGESAPGGANPDGSKLVKIGRVLMEGKEATVGQE